MTRYADKPVGQGRQARVQKASGEYFVCMGCGTLRDTIYAIGNGTAVRLCSECVSALAHLAGILT